MMHQAKKWKKGDLLIFKASCSCWACEEFDNKIVIFMEKDYSFRSKIYVNGKFHKSNFEANLKKP